MYLDPSIDRILFFAVLRRRSVRFRAEDIGPKQIFIKVLFAMRAILADDGFQKAIERGNEYAMYHEFRFLRVRSCSHKPRNEFR